MNRMKKVPALVLGFTLILTSFVSAFAVVGGPEAGEGEVAVTGVELADEGANLDAGALPEDVEGEELENAVFVLMADGAITGDTDGLFHPEQTLTRAQVVKMLVAVIDPASEVLFGTATQPAKYASAFTDLAYAQWAKPYIDYAAGTGIAAGYLDGTFRPSNAVTAAELETFVARAAGETSDAVFSGSPNATKAEAAVAIAGARDKIREKAAADKANAGSGQSAGGENAGSAEGSFETAGKTLSQIVSALSGAKLTYTASGSFSDAMDSFAGKALSGSLRILKYGKRINYGEDMKLSTRANDYSEESLARMKGVSSRAFYGLDASGKVSIIILPENTGYSGRAYAVINGVESANTADGKTDTLETLTAMQSIDWNTEADFSATAVTEAERKDGTLYELRLKDGKVYNIFKVTDAGKNENFKELTDGWYKVAEVDASRGLVQLDPGDGSGASWYVISDSSSYYLTYTDSDERDETYENASMSAIRKGNELRLYRVSKLDDEKEGNIVIIRK